MIVTFDPSCGNQITSNDPLYINFLRCVTAIATANAGITSLTVNPYTSTSGTNNALNCITGIIANTESGGWFTSSSHDVPAYPTAFTSMTSRTSYAAMYKADFWNDSGKGAMPFEKMTFHAVGHNTTGNDNRWNGRHTSAPLTNWNSTSGGQIQYTFGCSTTQAGDVGYIPSWSNTNANQQTTSFTNMAYISNAAGTNNADNTASGSVPSCAHGFNLNNYNQVYYTMAVTSEYCIIWETHKSSTYIGGFSSTYNHPTGGASMYGTLIYGGNRTTNSWEDTIANNPPWVTWNISHTVTSNQGMGGYTSLASNNGGSVSSFTSTPWSNGNPQPPNTIAAYMATGNASGAVTSSATRYQNYPLFQSWRNGTLANYCPVTNTGLTSANGLADSFAVPGQNGGTGTMDLVTPVFHIRSKKASRPNGGTFDTHSPYLPTVDTVTGTFVPGAYPIRVQRTEQTSWNPGGDCKGIYKSLSMTLANMKLYWSENQVFTVDGVPYMPIVFHEDMYLIKRV